MIPIRSRPISYKIPKNICADCGKVQSLMTPIEIELNHHKNYLIARTKKTIKIHVPLCPHCLKSYAKTKNRVPKTALYIVLIGLLVGIIVGFVSQDFSMICNIGVFSLIIAAIINLPKKSKTFATYDGRTITFTNRKFNAKFIELNNTLQSRKQIERLLRIEEKLEDKQKGEENETV